SGSVVTPNLFLTLGVEAIAGRSLTPDLDAPGSPRSAVLSRALWERRFGADPGIIGRSIQVDAEPINVVGVMPAWLQVPAGCDLWISSPFAVPPHPLNPAKDNSTSRDSHYMDVVGELMPGVTPSQASAEVNTIADRLKTQYANDEEYVGAAAMKLRDDMLAQTKPALLVLFGAVALLLLIACANVANLLLARGATRQKEITIRIALGARRQRVVRQLFTESIALALIDGGVGIVLAIAAMPLLQSMVPVDVLGGVAFRPDTSVLAFTLFISLASAILFGLFPSLGLANPDLNAILKEGGRGFGGNRRAQQTRSVLVVAEMALPTVLLIGAGVLIPSFPRVLAGPPGFNAEHVLTMQLAMPRARYGREVDRAAFVKRTLDAIRALSGITSASAISRLPLVSGRSTRSIDIKGRTPDPGGDPAPDYLVITP